MRILTAAVLAAVALSGCSVDSSVKRAVAGHAAAEGEGWTMQIVGDDADRMVLVVGPDGQAAAARIAGKESAMAGVAEVQTLLSRTEAAMAAAAPPPERVSITAPGVSIKVAGDDTAPGGRGKVAIDAGGVSIRVDGDDAGEGGRGGVRIAGVNAKAARSFIDGIDELSPEVKTQMYEKLGLTDG